MHHPSRTPRLRTSLLAVIGAFVLILPAPVAGQPGDAAARIAAIRSVMERLQGTPEVHGDGSTHIHAAEPLSANDLAILGIRHGSGPCLGVFELTAPADQHTCSHGPDPGPRRAPATAAVPYSAAPAPQGWSTPNSVPCYSTGPFVQVLWIYPEGSPNRLSTYAEYVRRTIGVVDKMFSVSASAVTASNGQPAIRHVKWAHNASCVPSIVAASVKAGNFGDISAQKSELASKGTINSSTKYLAFLDVGNSPEYCGGGLGELYSSTSTSQTNPSNQGGTWGQVYGCYSADPEVSTAPAHELMHTLGAVSYIAPHATGGHCWDDEAEAYVGNDIMCYADGYSGAFIRPSSCPITTPETFDCKKDDYFNPNPAPGNYLATHWNTASNKFLSAVAPPASWTFSLPSASLQGAGSFIGGETATITASTSTPAGRTITRVEFSIGGTVYDTDYSAPYSTDLYTFDYTNLANIKVTATPYDDINYPGYASTATYIVANPQVHLDWPTAFTLTSPIVNWTARAHAFGDRTVTSVRLTDGYGTPLGPPDTTAPYGGSVDLSALVYPYNELTQVSLGLEVIDSAGVHRSTNPIDAYLATSTIALPYSTSNGYPTQLASGSQKLVAIVNKTQTPAVAKVAFYVNSTLVGEDTTAPYSVPWTAPAGVSKTVFARLIDSAGYSRDSETTYVQVSTTGLGGTITAPASGASISGASVPVSVTPTVPAGWTVSDVGVQVGAGYTYGSMSPVDSGNPNGVWSGTLDATYANQGSNQLMATVSAYDATYQYGTVTGVPVSVTIANPVPTVTITGPANGATIKTTVNLSATVSGGTPDYVSFRVGGHDIDYDYTAPFSIPWDTMTGSDGIVRVNAIASGSWGDVMSAPRFYSIRNLYAWMGAPVPNQVISGKFLIKGGGRCDSDCALETATFWFDGVAVNYDRAAPYQFLLDTTKYANGPHTYAITITTNDYRAVSSAIYPVTVQN
ncbi:MAG: Ig-like domain-containing protein [Chloroflexota bacterium]